MKKLTPYEALKAAIDVLGSQAEVAKVCGEPVKQQHVSGWVIRSKRLPKQAAHHALKIEAATREKGEVILASQLVPEMFEGLSLANRDRMKISLEQ